MAVPISSLIVRTETAETEAVRALLANHPAIEVSHATADAIAIITETPGDDVDKHLWKQIEAFSGVTHVELIYHNFEDLEGTDHESNQT
jgi:nitrate reductase NapAB chaperone NapD